MTMKTEDTVPLEAAFKYAFKLQALADELRRAVLSEAFSRRAFMSKVRSAATQLREYAASAMHSSDPCGRVLAASLHVYADKLDVKASASLPVTPEAVLGYADKLDAEAQQEMNTERSNDDEKA